MYVVTFYSYKGGVGRSMAVVNIAYELAISGCRVLVVDFDLEAPGIETFNLPRPETETKGVVDFVTQYLNTGYSPEIKDFVYRSAIQTNTPGELWVMPAGVQDNNYAARLNSISWRQLYAERGGYLLFEDLKAQWKNHLWPDYVLIDSRTGFTDVSGICTRQLPNAVVCLFFPTEQNLAGLEKVVGRIRKENEETTRKDIRLLFVNSNVPDLDDEDQILEKRLNRFKTQLGYEALSGTIHHYSNLTLLNQVVFTRERPRSRLAAEYRALMNQIRRLNPEDRIGVLDYLNQFRSRTYALRSVKPSEKDFDNRVLRIHEAHRGDSEVLLRLADVLVREGRLEESSIFITEAIDAGLHTPEIYLRRADIAQRLGNKNLAIESIRQALAQVDADFADVRLGIRWLRALDSTELTDIAKWPAIESLSDEQIVELCQEHLSSDAVLLEVGEGLIRHRISTNPQSVVSLRAALTINLLGQGRAIEAKSLLAMEHPEAEDFSQADIFNDAMATWAVELKPPRDLFQRVLDIHTENEQLHQQSANYAQCIAIANWAVSRVDVAKEFLASSKNRIMSHPAPEYSCWRYQTVEPILFLQDLEEIERLLKGEDVRPIFMDVKGI
jgi:cellulose biosynthesis protein BcsQ